MSLFEAIFKSEAQQTELISCLLIPPTFNWRTPSVTRTHFEQPRYSLIETNFARFMKIYNGMPKT